MDGDSAAAIAETQLHYQAPCAFAHRNLICAEVEDHHASSPSRNARYSGGGAFEGVTPTVSPQAMRRRLKIRCPGGNAQTSPEVEGQKSRMLIGVERRCKGSRNERDARKHHGAALGSEQPHCRAGDCRHRLFDRVT